MPTIANYAKGDLTLRAVRREWKHLASERTDGLAPSILFGPRFWPLLEGERARSYVLKRADHSGRPFAIVAFYRTNRAIKIMIGIGTPRKSRSRDRIVFSV